MGLFERYLSVWVGLAIIIGIVLGSLAPGMFAAIASIEYAHVNLVIAVLIWLMIYPMMLGVDRHEPCQGLRDGHIGIHNLRISGNSFYSN